MSTPRRLIAVLATVAVAAFGLSACSAGEPSDVDKKSAAQELTSRGFTEPRWESSLGSYTVGVGTCRFPARITFGSAFDSNHDWQVLIPSEADGSEWLNANVSMLKEKDAIGACFS